MQNRIIEKRKYGTVVYTGPHASRLQRAQHLKAGKR